MSRFLLFYTGRGPKPLADVAGLDGIPGVTVVAQPSPRTVVLDISDELAAQRVRRLPHWVLQQSQPLALDEPDCLSPSAVPGLRLVR